MTIELIIALIIGIIAGTLTGLAPGIHINIISAGLVSIVAGGAFSSIPIIALVVFVVSMAITHTMIDFIPSVFLGAPEEDSFLAVLPGHELLLEGKGYEAVVLLLKGAMIGVGIATFFSIVFVLFLPTVFSFVEGIIGYILILVSLYLILSEESFVHGGIVFLFAGFLGLISFRLPVEEPLLPLLTGLFGISGLVVSMRSRVSLAHQQILNTKDIRLPRRVFWKNVFAASIAGPLCSFLPGIGSGHAATLGSSFGGEDRRGFLFLVGALSTIVMGLSFVTMYAIGKTRTGASAAVLDLLQKISISDLIIILSVVVISGGIAYAGGLFFARLLSKYVSQIRYSLLSLIVIVLLILVVAWLSNVYGLFVLITGSSLGIYAIVSKTRRIQLMGCLLIPTIVWYLF